ncbi:MAG: DUF5110 domain-containing protein [Clostridia bacterium]|nr:DUF5110 domain-containing protein [Clostridia bacterium]
MNLYDIYNIKADGKAADAAVKIIGALRITMLTPCLIRIENGAFTDAQTQTVLNRRFPVPDCEIEQKGGSILIRTAKTVLCIQANSGKPEYIKTKDCGAVTNFDGNLKGTYRTLDMKAANVPLGDGILSINGAAKLDDSGSLLLDEDGRPVASVPRSDVYYFTYGKHYREALRDFFRLTGFPPMLPRFCFGNWWSRYHAYTQQEYLSLMDRFAKERIPFSVATIDMDWHWVDVEGKFGKEAAKEGNRFLLGSGWTGYSWNTDLFPDYKAFLKELHKRKLKTTVNLHPADGVRFFEDSYPQMANAMGIDPATKQRIKFDIADKTFTDAYFKYLHHGYERDGVDFWWIDWQQEKTTAIPGLDPLWALNHYHYLDACRNGKRGLILSRFAGAGSHRYPLGFSGDAIMNRAALNFQPYFTATASNIGYTWWSHDIGGHHLGVHSDELYLRWLQLGVFSPINRLHSTADIFMGKEPWNYQPDTQRIATRWLRLRKQLVPYIYSAARRTYTEGKALCEPMYYEYPDSADAYRVRNQYLFGGDLIVAPITEKKSKLTGLGGTTVFLNGGRYTDIFTGDVYTGKGLIKMFRNTDSIPVLAKAGTILPLDADSTGNGTANPKALELLIFSGNGSYTLYEDDGETLRFKDGAYTTRMFTVSETADALIFTLNAATGDTALVPAKRAFRLDFRNIGGYDRVEVDGGDAYKIDKQADTLVLTLPGVTAAQSITVRVYAPRLFINASREEKRIRFFSRMQGNNVQKKLRYTAAAKCGKLPLHTPAEIREPLEEIAAMVE